MIELVLTVCSIVQGANCREVSLTFSDVSLMTCMVGAQPQIAMWKEGHPNFTVNRWTCRAAGQYAKA